MKYLLAGLMLLLQACALPWSQNPDTAMVDLPRTEPHADAPLSWEDITSRPTVEADHKHFYGSAPQQFGDLYLPTGEAPEQGWPTVALIHGGCWLAQFDLQYFRHWADALRQAGFAVWNLEYRRIGDDGGGWPGSFADIADGLDALAHLENEFSLDLSRLALIGHSAGGHLALWAAQRRRLPEDSELHRPIPQHPRVVLGLAPITDLREYRKDSSGSCNAAVDQLMGGSPQDWPERYEQGNPQPTFAADQYIALVYGEEDSIVPGDGVENFARALQSPRPEQRILLGLPEAGHFDLAVPTSQTRPWVLAYLRQALPIRPGE